MTPITVVSSPADWGFRPWASVCFNTELTSFMVAPSFITMIIAWLLWVLSASRAAIAACLQVLVLDLEIGILRIDEQEDADHRAMAPGTSSPRAHQRHVPPAHCRAA
jgi:hypothetical protein